MKTKGKMHFARKWIISNNGKLPRKAFPIGPYPLHISDIEISEMDLHLRTTLLELPSF